MEGKGRCSAYEHCMYIGFLRNRRMSGIAEGHLAGFDI